MNNSCCLNCQAKAKKKKLKKLKEESNEEDVKQKQKVPENTDSTEEEGSHGTSDQKKNILTWRHPSTKKEKVHHGNNLFSEKFGVNPPRYTPMSMMYRGGFNPSNQWSISAVPRGGYPAFSKAPMHGPHGGCGQCHPYQYMNQHTMYNGALISPYPPMAAAPFPPYWQPIPFMDTNPMTRYTSYADNYSYCFI